MILKKPYAFLIKNFRWIHLILSVLIAYLLIKTYNIYGFFSNYVTNSYAALSETGITYITVFMFLISIIIILSSIAMYLLMRKKDKPVLLYVLLSVYYLILFIAFIIYFVLFRGLESVSISIKDAMLYRDATLIVMLPQIIFLVFAFIRGVGFDIKKFNFSKDLKELDLEEEDSEEVEVALGLETYKYERFFRRRIREFKYYYLENKFMFTILAGLVVAVLAIILILNFTVYNRTYNKNQKIIANNLGVTVNNSYLTNIDYTGNIIEEGKYFLVANVTFANTSGLSTVLNMSHYELKTNSGTVYPTLSRSNYFVDLGAGYQKEKIESGKTVTYILVYELNEKQKANKYTLRIIDEVNYKAGVMSSKAKNISLKPLVYESSEVVGTYGLGTTVTMYESILNNSSLQFNSYEFKNKYTYKYEACIRSSCSDKTDIVVADAGKSKTLLILDGSVVLDKNSTFRTNLKTNLSFFDAFVTIRYDDKVSVVTNKTPVSLTEGYVLEVDEKAQKASKIDLIVTVRDKKYIVTLKG